MNDLRSELGSIDIYWFDQLLRGRVGPGMRVLDVGCGTGRNLVYLLRLGHDVTAVDRDPACVAELRARADRLGRPLSGEQALVGEVDALPFADGSFDVVLCCAVLHFAEDHSSFDRMTSELSRVLAPGGLLFCRLASSIGIEALIEPLGSGRFRLPDGSTRYLVDEARLAALTDALGDLADPLKTTVVQGQRSMTTWVVRKRG